MQFVVGTRTKITASTFYNNTVSIQSKQWISFYYLFWLLRRNVYRPQYTIIQYYAREMGDPVKSFLETNNTKWKHCDVTACCATSRIQDHNHLD